MQTQRVTTSIWLSNLSYRDFFQFWIRYVTDEASLKDNYLYIYKKSNKKSFTIAVGNKKKTFLG